MRLDLPTVLLLRLGIDVLVAGAFWAQHRRYPAIGGPGWWSLGAVFSIVGSLGLMLHVGGAGPMMAAASAVLLFTAHASSWLGLRSYLRWSVPWRGLLALVLVMAVLHTVQAQEGDQPSQHQLLYAVSGLVLAFLVLRDLLRLKPQRSQPEFLALCWVTCAESLVLLVVVGWVLTNRPSLDGVASGFLSFFLLTKLLRMIIYSALVSLRLRQEAEQARRSMAEREADSRALITNLGAGVVVFRPDRSVVLANSAARRFFGWPVDGAEPADLAHGSTWSLVRDDGAPLPRHEVPFERVLATGQPVIGLVGGMRMVADGTVRWALCNAYPENDALGGLRHVVFTFVDITSLQQAREQQKALEQQLAQSHKMEALGTLAGGVAHDFNNILAAILGNADLARQDLPLGSPAGESLHEISSAARRGRELVRQILAYSRQQPMARTRVCLRDTLTETCSLLRTAITPQIQLVVDVAAGTPTIRADATQLGQVLLNLGTNAIHALEGRPGRIGYRVEALLRSDRRLPTEVAQVCRESGVDAVCVSVSDNGSGMDKATLARVFEPFFTTKPVGSGTGLGLPVVLGIVLAHGGAIEVDSTPGLGTVFHLFFPAATELGASDAPAGPALDGTIPPTVTPAAESAVLATEELIEMAEEPTATRRHVLYLDDDETLVFLVRRLLERRGYQVTAMTDQQQAIDAVRAQPDAFQLLMTDYNMPGMSGIEVARQVLAINPKLPVAVASGYISDELQTEAAAAGVCEVVFKTDAVDAFCEVVARLVTPPRPA